MTDLHEKIANIYCEESMGMGISELNEYAGPVVANCFRVADRILDLLPKLGWRADQLFLGSMNITEAARATRKYSVWCAHDDRKPWVWEDGKRLAGPFEDYPGARAVCDRLNLLAVLKALSEPSDGMLGAALHKCPFVYSDMVADIWRAMIDAAIKEIEAND